MCKSKAFPWCLLGRALCPSAFRFENCVGRLGSPCSLPGGGKSQGCLLLAAKTLLQLWPLCDLSLKLSSSPILSSASALPVTPMFRVILGNFESQTEVDSPKGASSPCPLCCTVLTAYPGVLRWLFCAFCGYSDRLNAFLI